MRIEPPPTDEEAAAIAAALELMWPTAAVAVSAAPVQTSWRFSGRPWHSRPTWRKA